MQAASQMYVSDAAMDATLNGRAEYARILADLGFVSREYAAHCNSPGTSEDVDDQDAMSRNARVIKAAICAGTTALHRRAVRLYCACINIQCSEGLLILKCKGCSECKIEAQSCICLQASIPAFSGLSTLPGYIQRYWEVPWSRTQALHA